MKRLFAFLLLFLILLPIWIWAQGFGGFSSDQPYFAKDTVSTSSPFTVPVEGTEFWWVFTNLVTNAFVTNWTDQVQAKLMNQKSGGIITNTSSGVAFPNTSSEQWLSNTVTGGPFSTNLNTMAIGFIINFQKTQAANAGLYADNSVNDKVYFSPSGGQNPWHILDQISGNTVTNGYINTNQWVDLIYANTNTGSNLSCYTNGVFSKYQARTMRRFATLGDMFIGSRTVMTIRDVIIITNVSNFTENQVVSNWHRYRTNTYGP